VWSTRNSTAAGSLVISNPGKQPVSVSSPPVLAVTSVVPKGAPAPPPDAGRGKLRAFRPYDGPFDVAMAILEWPLPGCFAGADAVPVVVPPGKAVTCAFRSPLAAVAGADARGVNVSVSFAVGSGAAGGVCAADAARLTVV
jgi:hypothetical protein